MARFVSGGMSLAGLPAAAQDHETWHRLRRRYGSGAVFRNPIVVDRTAYILAKNCSIVALDATTG
jgi:hypothetical protein